MFRFDGDAYCTSSLSPKVSLEYKPGIEYLMSGYPRDINDLSRKNETLYRKNFLYESDTMDKRAQFNIIMNLENKDLIRYVVDSGNKSLHIWISLPNEVPLQLLELCSKYIKESWEYVATLYGLDISLYDKQCKNVSRLGRAPNGIRSDNGKIQRCLHEGQPMNNQMVNRLYRYLLNVDKRAKEMLAKRKSLSALSSILEDENGFKKLPLETKLQKVKKKTENMEVLEKLFNKEPVPAGSNLCGALASAVSLGCTYEEVEAIANEAHRQHPSNISNPIRKAEEIYRKYSQS